MQTLKSVSPFGPEPVPPVALIFPLDEKQDRAGPKHFHD